MPLCRNYDADTQDNPHTLLCAGNIFFPLNCSHMQKEAFIYSWLKN